MTNNNHKSACGFSETLVSYLYGEEIGAAEKSRFEAHALNCRVCSDELSAFGGIRSAFQSWREQEFAPLATPVFELPTPQETPQPIAALAANKRDFGGWTARLREMISANLMWSAGAAIAFAALAVCFGLFSAAYLTPNGDHKKDMAEISQPLPGSPPAAAVSVSPVVNKTNSDVSEKNSKQSMPENAPKSIALAPGSKTNSAKPSSRETNKAAGSEIQQAVNVKPNVRAKSATKAATVLSPPARRTTSPRAPEIEFSSRVEEDRSLRLMDLFDEIGKL